jgi:ureidoglycolate lyase
MAAIPTRGTTQRSSNPRILVPQPLTAATFASFGDVVEMGAQFDTINRGTVHAFADLANIDVAERGGRPRVGLYRVSPYPLPMAVAMLERHPLGSQLFMPLRKEPFVVVVAQPGDRVSLASVTAFVTNGEQGINYHKGTWHHPVIALREGSEFLVLDREGPGDNYEECTFEPESLILQAPST